MNKNIVIENTKRTVMSPLFESHEKGFMLLRRGKVRDIYSIGNNNHLMIIASDRISAFDCVLPTAIPEKGRILTQMSNHWFQKTEHIIKNHLVDTDPHWMDWDYDKMKGRVVLVKKAEPLPVECVVRGYLAGSGFEEYRRTGSICGIRLPSGLQESDELPEPIFTPSTKAPAGEHDENISFETASKILGNDLAGKVRDISLKIYSFAKKYAYERGIILADTKFEFGLVNGELILIDELLTPDSSRFWPLHDYKPGQSNLSFDKQFVRDYLVSIRWNKKPPAPQLPAEIVDLTMEKYNDAFRLLFL